jgi:hypothetical protein
MFSCQNGLRHSFGRWFGWTVYDWSVVESDPPRSVATNSCQLLLEVGKLMSVSVTWLGVSRVSTPTQNMHYLVLRTDIIIISSSGGPSRAFSLSSSGIEP